MTETDTLVGPGEAALLLRVSTKTILRWTESGKLELAGRTSGGQRRYRLADVERIVAERGAA